MQTEAASLGPGFRVGHWTDPDASTGCTVVLAPSGTLGACDVRGSSPGSRELNVLDPDSKLTEVHAVLLTGGSAFGLAAADGVVSWLEERGIGYQTPVATVPIVPAAVIFDLAAGRADARPGPGQGRAACDAARAGSVETGRVGAGTGATVGKWAGIEYRSPGGLGIAAADEGDATVRALAVVNPVGDVVDDNGTVIAGSTAPTPRRPGAPAGDLPINTVLTVATVHGPVGKRAARWLAQRASDGVTVAVKPAHTRYDGDVAFVLVAPTEDRSDDVDLDLLGYLVTEAVAAAVRAAVR